MSERKNTASPSTAQSVDSGLQDSAYPKPVVEQANLDTLSPMGALPDGIKVLVTYPSMTTSDVITLKFNRDDTFVPQYGTDAHTVSFPVNPSHVGAALGKTIEVTYTVTRQETEVSSETLNLKVLSLMKSDLNMVAITQATASTPGTLDLSKFSGDAELKITPWPFIAKNQQVWMDMISKSSTQHLLNAHPVTPEEVTSGITHLISRRSLETIPDGSLLTFSGKFQTDGSGSTTDAQEFEILELSLKHGGGETGDIVEAFETYPSGPTPDPFVARNMTFKGSDMRIGGTDASRWFKASVQNGKPELTVTLNGCYKKATIDVASSNSYGFYFRCFYQDGQVDEKRVTASSFKTLEFNYAGISSFTATSIYEDRPVEITIDNLKLYE